jgi:ferredoxin
VAGKRRVKRIPVIDREGCSDCESCLELCLGILRKNEETGLIEVVDLDEYPEEDLQEAMGMCPSDCITWKEVPR